MQFQRHRCLLSSRMKTTPRQPYRFVRVPTELLETLLRSRLSGTQWSVLLWTVRYTYGWNRRFTPFTWYRIAKELRLSRPAIYRTGQALLAARILVVQDKQLMIQTDYTQWDTGLIGKSTNAGSQLWMPGMNVAREQRSALRANNALVPHRVSGGCSGATFVRRTKDSSKDKLKTSKEQHRFEQNSPPDKTSGSFQTEPDSLQQEPPNPFQNKYDSLSQN